MANPWFRLYSKIMTDPKVEYLSFEDQRHFVWLLCMKNEGYLDEEFPTKLIREKMISRKLGIHGEAFENAKSRLMEVGLINRDWQPISWDELQFKSDSSKERVRKYRENKRKSKGKRECNVTVTPQDTDTEEDKESDTDQREGALSENMYTIPSKFCPHDFIPNPIAERQFMARVAPGVDRELELAKFKNHEFQYARSDWDRAWAKWMLTAKPGGTNDNDGPNKLQRRTDKLLNRR